MVPLGGITAAARQVELLHAVRVEVHLALLRLLGMEDLHFIFGLLFLKLEHLLDHLSPAQTACEDVRRTSTELM